METGILFKPDDPAGASPTGVPLSTGAPRVGGSGPGPQLLLLTGAEEYGDGHPVVMTAPAVRQAATPTSSDGPPDEPSAG